MLEYAANVALGEGLALTTLVADMTDFHSDECFGAAVNPMSSFRMLLDDDEVGRHLARMAAALVPGGAYLLDLTFGTDGTPESDLDEWVMARDDVVVSAKPDAVSVVDRAKGLELTLDWHEALRPYTAEQFATLVRRDASFEVAGCYCGAEPGARSSFARRVEAVPGR